MYSYGGSLRRCFRRQEQMERMDQLKGQMNLIELTTAPPGPPSGNSVDNSASVLPYPPFPPSVQVCDPSAPKDGDTVRSSHPPFSPVRDSIPGTFAIPATPANPSSICKNQGPSNSNSMLDLVNRRQNPYARKIQARELQISKTRCDYRQCVKR